jgi:hypothetical protein
MVRYLVIVCALLSGAGSTVLAAPPIASPWMAGGTWQASGACGGSYYGEDAHTNTGGKVSAFAIDFNRHAVCQSDDRYPVVASAPGRVVFAGVRTGFGNTVEVDHGIVNGKRHSTFYAHFHDDMPIVVKKGEYVVAGQVLGYCGMSGGTSTGIHLHFEQREDGQSVRVSAMDGYDFCEAATCRGHVLLSRNTGVLDAEFNSNGESGAYGTRQDQYGAYAGVHWHYTYDGSNRYRSNNLANNCYVQNWAGSTYNTCGIVYDALGGARRAYTVRNGFYHDSNNQGWNDRGGPNSDLGMPLTNEYAYQGGARQDFQTGYLRYQQGHSPTEVWREGYSSAAPGWTSSGWHNQFSYLMAMAYDRNGRSPAVGNATGPAGLYYFTAHGKTSSYYRQDFTSVTNGDGAIFYHPENHQAADGTLRNSLATNEAYYVYGLFWSRWQQLGADACGVPTRDWYMSYDPVDWNPDSTFHLQNFMRADGEQHYMIRKWDAPTGQWKINFHSSYNCDWVTQSPFVANLFPGQASTFRSRTRTRAAQHGSVPVQTLRVRTTSSFVRAARGPRVTCRTAGSGQAVVGPVLQEWGLRPRLQSRPSRTPRSPSR